MTPRPKVERVARSIRLRKDADDALVEQAKAAGRSVNAHIEWLVVGEGAARLTEDLSDFMLRPSAEYQRAACPHPRKSRQVFSWGSKCGECGRRL